MGDEMKNIKERTEDLADTVFAYAVVVLIFLLCPLLALWKLVDIAVWFYGLL